MPVYSGSSSRVGRRDVGVVQILGGDHYKNILSLQDRAPDVYHMHYKASL